MLGHIHTTTSAAAVVTVAADVVTAEAAVLQTAAADTAARNVAVSTAVSFFFLFMDHWKTNSNFVNFSPHGSRMFVKQNISHVRFSIQI